jgi:hypothetical protein
MRKSRFTEEEVIAVLKGCRSRAEGRGPLAEARDQQHKVAYALRQAEARWFP